MEILTISGGSGLFGEVRIPGAKNSVLPIMAASVLCRGTVTLTDVPQDVYKRQHKVFAALFV